uniref:FAD-binding domain-containing protein n=1 Tax=Aegilops tauschii subsp. strangulata TaxID=200361 RepID=A0A453ISU8_AEGTS
MEEQDEITAEHVVVVGAGPAGLAVALGLHRKGVRSVVLESSPALRASGYAITTWPNAFRALDALGVGHKPTRSGSSTCTSKEDPMRPAASRVTCCSGRWRRSCRRAPSATPPRSSPSTTKTAPPRSSISPTARLSEQRS